MASSRQRLPLSGTSWTLKLGLLLAIALLLPVIIRGLYLMRSSFQVGFMAAIPASSDHAHTSGGIDIGWYPPNISAINDLNVVINGEGVYGFVYNTSTTPADIPYSTYNWCNMPHVRAAEYVIPPPQYQLQYVEVIHRHHKRTPYADNSFPIESYPWDCDDEELFYYGQPKAGTKSAHTYWQGYTSSANPFTHPGWQGTCQFPQITAEGLQDSWQHGKDLYGVYHDLLGFLPDDIVGKVTFRVTNNVITSEVAGMIVGGMFGADVSAPLLIQKGSVDSLEPSYPCPQSTHLFTSIHSSPAWTNLLQASSPLYRALDTVSDIPSSDFSFHSSIDHYYDNLSARQCHSKPLPCSISSPSTCINQSLADSVYRLGHYEYSYTYRDNPISLEASIASFGVWIVELRGNIRDFLEGKSKVKYRHNVAHDGSIARLLSILQIEDMVWPGMGSEVVFEVYKDSTNSEYCMRVLWKGQVLRSSNLSLGVLDMVPLETILGYLDGLVGEDASLIKAKCESPSV